MAQLKLLPIKVHYNPASLEKSFFERCIKFKWCYSENEYFKGTPNQSVIKKWQLFGIQWVQLWITSFEY